MGPAAGLPAPWPPTAGPGRACMHACPITQSASLACVLQSTLTQATGRVPVNGRKAACETLPPPHLPPHTRAHTRMHMRARARTHAHARRRRRVPCRAGDLRLPGPRGGDAVLAQPEGRCRLSLAQPGLVALAWPSRLGWPSLAYSLAAWDSRTERPPGRGAGRGTCPAALVAGHAVGVPCASTQWPGLAWPGPAWPGPAWPGLVWCGVVQW